MPHAQIGTEYDQPKVGHGQACFACSKRHPADESGCASPVRHSKLHVAVPLGCPAGSYRFIPGSLKHVAEVLLR